MKKERKKGAQKKEGETSPISPPLDPRLCGHQKVSRKFFLHSKTQKREVFNDFSSHENIPTPEPSQESS